MGRRHLFRELEARFPVAHPLIWVHASSAGEFEQAKPLIEALKKDYPAHKVLVSFFSPSGYAQGQKWKPADHVCYLPADTRRNAERFLRAVRPLLVVFVKYDFWYHHLKAVNNQKIPLLLVSAIFRPGQVFFKWYGGLHRLMLRFFTHLFVQDEPSISLLHRHGFAHATCSGDTRFDRVAAIAEYFHPLPLIQAFSGNRLLLVAGSTWPADEQLLAAACSGLGELKLVIAPHEIHHLHLQQIEKRWTDTIRYSQLEAQQDEPGLHLHAARAKVLIIDNIGMLSRLYHYATFAYIGGGFNKTGIHNTLEAAVYGKPLLFGPEYQKFKEASDLIRTGAAYSCATADALRAVLKAWIVNKSKREEAGQAAAGYVQHHKGATRKILSFIIENELLLP